MKLTHKTNNFAIFDQVFDQDKFEKIVRYFCMMDYEKNTKLQKVWRICDGEHLAGMSLNSKDYPYRTPADALHFAVKHLAENYVTDIVGKENEDWSFITYRPYIYPQGTRISWHNDHGYVAACIFYCHTEWNPSWGGELMVANTPPPEAAPAVDTPDHYLSRSHIKPTLDYYGFGNYISCLPNRMVFTKGCTWHMINRVDKDAGENLRCSFVAFFHPKK